MRVTFALPARFGVRSWRLPVRGWRLSGAYEVQRPNPDASLGRAEDHRRCEAVDTIAVAVGGFA